MTASIEELKRAWQAVEAGRFRDTANPAEPCSQRWVPESGERVLPVLGAHGSSGATVLSLALATAAAPARVVECTSLGCGGLVAAPTAELGDRDGHWTRGSRGDVLVERISHHVSDASRVPSPSTLDRATQLTVVDVGWSPAQVMDVDSWLATTVLTAPFVVVTTTATVPGLRRLESALALLPPDRCIAAVLGPPRRRWPKILARTFGPITTSLDAVHRLVTVPMIPALAVAGIDATPLPGLLLTAAADVLRLAGEPSIRKDLP